MKFSKSKFYVVNRISAVGAPQFSLLKILPIAVLLCIAINFSAYTQVGYWKLNNDYTDASGNAITGTPMGAPAFSTDRMEGSHSLSFNGTNQWVDLGNPQQFPSGLQVRTICAWAKSNVTSGNGVIFSIGTPTTTNAFYIGISSTSIIGGAFGNSLTGPTLTSGWHHICLTYDGATASLYVDGSLSTSASRTWNLILSKAYIGRHVSNNNYWNGNIDDVRIYNVALSATQVQALYNSALVPAPPTNLVATASSPTSVNLNWDDNSSNETGFQIDRALSLTGTYSPIATTAANTMSYQHTGLNQSTTYFYKVKAVNGSLSSASTPASNASTYAAAPTNLVASAASSNTIFLKWNDNSTFETGFQIQQKIAGGTYATVFTTAADVTSFTQTGLNASTQYFYQVKAIDAGNGSTFSAAANATTWSVQQSVLQNLAFQYQYDDRDRMIAKKVPGSDWVYMIYDARDRVVMTQDANQRSNSKKEWSFTKYDVLNRPILTGITTVDSVLTQAKMQRRVNVFYSGGGSYYETFTGTGIIHGYGNTSYPQESNANNYLTVSYYDNYNFKTSWGTAYNYGTDNLSATAYTVTYTQPTSEFTSVIGQATGSKVKVLDGGSTGGYTWLKTVNYYDDKYRVVQTVSDNYKSGEDRISNLYDFTGKVLKNKTTHVERDVTWKDLVGVAQIGNKLIKTNASNAWNSGAASVQQLPAGQDGYLEMVVSEVVGNRRMVGLASTNTDSNYPSINYALYLNTNTLQIYEGGQPKSIPATSLAPGDLLKIQRTGNTVSYYKNAALIYTSLNSSNTLLMADVSLYDYNANPNATTSVVGVRTSFSTTQTSITRSLEYDHAGRLLKTYHQIGTGSNVLLAQNEYNELGQLVDKKVHSISGAAAQQSVDYRYNIRGWLTSMNNASVNINSANNDESTDYFGFELGYNNDIGTTNVAMFNGNISGMKWSNNMGLSTVKEKNYNYSYDPLNRITGAAYKVKTTAWAAAANNGFSESNYTYDLNGNIKTLLRYDENGSTRVMDNLTYDYGTGTTQGNQLKNVTDAGSIYKGFADQVVSGTNDYTYDGNGNMTTDQNKGITSAITYNFLNLPEKVGKGGNEIQYIYDATGRKLAQVTNMSGVQKQSDYAGEFQYENDMLQSIQHEEGRVVMASTSLVAQHNGEATSGIASSNATLAAATANGTEKYVTATATNTTVRSGITAIGSTLTVTAGDRYRIRIKGYRVKGSATSSNPVYVSVKGNSTDIVWPGAALPSSAASESWVEQIVIIPTGVTQLTIGLNWSAPTAGEVIYFNAMEVNKESTQTPEYQYHMKDHLGNVRLTFTSKQETESATATMETVNSNAERAKFLYYDEAIIVNHNLFDHTYDNTTGATYYATRLTGGTTNAKFGLAKSLAVMPGDVINTQVYAKYVDTNNANWTTAFNTFMTSIANGSAPAGTVVDGGSSGSLGGGTYPVSTVDHSAETGTAPKAYLNYLVFNKDMALLDGGYVRITTNSREYGQNAAHDLLSKQLTIKEPGYVYLYLSNENATAVEVYFDDFKVDQVKSPVVQMDDYYPFGLTFNSYSRENAAPNMHQYNWKEKQEELGLDWLDYGARMYMPEIGKWGVVDPKSEKYFPFSPYCYAANMPIIIIDPNGMELDYSHLKKGERREYRKLFREMSRMGPTAKAVVKFLKSKDSGTIRLLNKPVNSGLGVTEPSERVTNELGGDPIALNMDGLDEEAIGAEITVDLQGMKDIRENPLDVLVEEAAHAAIYSAEANFQGDNMNLKSNIGRGTNEFTSKAIVGQIEKESGRKITDFTSGGDAPAREWGRNAFANQSTAGFFDAARNWRDKQTNYYRNGSLGNRIPAFLRRLIKN
jgi:RHS repeat-associated protein